MVFPLLVILHGALLTHLMHYDGCMVTDRTPIFVLHPRSTSVDMNLASVIFPGDTLFSEPSFTRRGGTLPFFSFSVCDSIMV